MTQPKLPPELHQLILDTIGDEVVHAELALRKVMGSARETLRTCSLVCRDWHDLTLRHTFYNTNFVFFGGDRDMKRQAELFRLLEINPLIRRCIRRTDFHLQGDVLRGHVEAMCNAISPIEILRIVFETSGPELDFPRPSLLDCLYPLLTTPDLRDLSIATSYFPLHVLGCVANLQSLTLTGVQMVDMGKRGDKAWSSSTVEKLVVANGSRVLTQIGVAIKDNEDLHAFFQDLKHLDMDLAGEESLLSPPWRVLLVRWIHLETLVFHWTARSLGKFVSIRTPISAADAKLLDLSTENSVQLFEMSQIIPWESFQRLRSLTYDITFGIMGPNPLFEADAHPSKTIFSGPSYLPQLQHLHITHHHRTSFPSIHHIFPIFDAIYLHNLNKTIENPSSFSSLRAFHTEVKGKLIQERRETSPTLDNGKLAQLVVDRLPAVFGPGGRKETYGWATSIVSNCKMFLVI